MTLDRNFRVCDRMKLQASSDWPVVRWVWDIEKARIVSAQVMDTAGSRWREPEFEEWRLIDRGFPAGMGPPHSFPTTREPIWAEGNPRRSPYATSNSRARESATRHLQDILDLHPKLDLAKQGTDDVPSKAGKASSDPQTERQEGPGVVFGKYPISVARAILGHSIEEIAALRGIGVHTWHGYEDGSLAMSDECLKILEDDVKADLATIGFDFVGERPLSA
jgi:hypothetical protein